jgi:hypothetical protein
MMARQIFRGGDRNVRPNRIFREELKKTIQGG